MLDYAQRGRDYRTIGRIEGGTAAGVTYPSPFFDIAHTYLPPSIRQLFRWCRYYFLTNPYVSATVMKMAEYPITDFVIDARDKAVKDRWEAIFEEDLELRPRAIDIGLFYHCYGNSPISLHIPSQKWLTCPLCRHTVPIHKAKYRFRSFKFWMTCERCKQSENATVSETPLKTTKGMRLILWNPEDVEMRHDPISGKSTYYYALPGHTRNQILLGDRVVIENMPQTFIESVRKEKALILHGPNVFHMKRPSIFTDDRDRGMGTPLILPVLKSLFYLQLMMKAQEQILIERIVPLTVVFPQAASGTSDPWSTVNLVNWKEMVSEEIQRWRRDRNYIPIMPLPLGNQVIGGDGRTLLMHQEMRLVAEQIIAGMGVPAEFVFGGLQWSGSNVSLRMLENQFMRYLSGLLRFINHFLIPKISTLMDIPPVKVRFKPFKMADDIQKMALWLQLNQMGKVSDTTLLQANDLNPEEEDALLKAEVKRRTEAMKAQQLAEAEIAGEAGLVQAKYQAKAQTMAMQEQAQAQAGMAGSAPGEPSEAMGSQPTGAPDPITQIISRVTALDPASRQNVLKRIGQRSPQFAQDIVEKLQTQKPLPTQLPPRRGAGPV